MKAVSTWSLLIQRCAIQLQWTWNKAWVILWNSHEKHFFSMENWRGLFSEWPFERGQCSQYKERRPKVKLIGIREPFCWWILISKYGTFNIILFRNSIASLSIDLTFELIAQRYFRILNYLRLCLEFEKNNWKFFRWNSEQKRRQNNQSEVKT